jgi:cytosine permease
MTTRQIASNPSLLEDYSRHEVPRDKTRTWLSMGLIWSGVGISLGLLLTGGTIGDGMTLPAAAIAAFVGGIMLALIASATGIVGNRTHLSTAMISRFTFGKQAILLIAFIQALGSYGWFAVQLGLFGETAAVSWQSLTGGSLPGALFIIVGGLLMISTAIFGYKGIDILSKAAVPLLILLIGASVWRIMADSTISDVSALEGSGEPVSMGVGISLVVSSFVVGAVIAPDVSRYSRSSADTIGGAVLAFAVVTPLVLICGTLMAQATGTWDIVDIMLRLGWGVLALLLLMFAQWTSNDNNLYGASLALAVIFRRLQKWQLTLIAGGVGILLALAGIYDNFITFLSVLGILIPPMAGVIVADYFLIRKYRYATAAEHQVRQIRILPMSAWAIGSLVVVLTTYTALTLTTVPALDGLLVAGVLQYLLGRYVEADPESTAARAQTQPVTQQVSG